MSKLFESTTIKNMQLDNRFIRSATWMGMAAEDGSCTPKLIDVMAKLAQGGVGLIMTGYSHVLKGGQSVPWQMGCFDDVLLPGLTEMATVVHESGGKIAMQMVHGGVFSIPELTGEEVLGPSAMQTEKGPVGREMTKEEIQETVEAFVKAASRAKKAGFDGVQIHVAHGYLLNQFLSPFFNKRTDEYGGSLDNRARMIMQVVSGVHEAVGDAFPVFVKLNSDDLLDGGFTKKQMLEVCVMLQAAGIDAIELSGGTGLGLALNKLEITPFPVGNGEVYWREATELYNAKVDVPLMLVGGLRSYETAEKLVEAGVVDYVSLSRPLIREPDLINRWKKGDMREADCVRDNACFKSGMEGQGIRCFHLDQ